MRETASRQKPSLVHCKKNGPRVLLPSTKTEENKQEISILNIYGSSSSSSSNEPQSHTIPFTSGLW